MADTPRQEIAHQKLRGRWEELTFDGLSRPEQEAIALFWLEGEVMNGGLIQFFVNSSGDLSEYVLSGLSRLGCTTSLRQFECALQKLNLGEQIASREARIDALSSSLEAEIDPFDAETTVLQALPEDFFRLALDDLAARDEASHA